MRTHLATFLVLGSIWLPRGTFGAEQADAALPSGVKAVWDLDKAYRERSPTRERVCLNGLWRWQPAAASQASVPAGTWGFFKVPGAWPGRDEFARKESQTAFPHTTWKNQDLTRVIRAWYQREFTVPGDWTGRRIALSLNYLNSVATVYVDGRKLGKLRFPAGELDLTTAVQPGGKPVAGLDGHSRGRCSSPVRASHWGGPVHHSALPDPRSDRFTITSIDSTHALFATNVTSGSFGQNMHAISPFFIVRCD